MIPQGIANLEKYVQIGLFWNFEFCMFIPCEKSKLICDSLQRDASLFLDTEFPICFFSFSLSCPVTFTDCKDRGHVVLTSSDSRVKVNRDGTLTVSKVFLLFSKCFPIFLFSSSHTCTISCKLIKVRTMHACQCCNRLRERLLSVVDG